MFCVLLFATAIPCLSQTYDFQNFTVEDGLSQSQILCLYQISNGELWMGTNQGGINHYNGSSFSYTTKTEGLSDNVVFSVCELDKDRVLVGTNNGLNIISGSEMDTISVADGLPHKGVVSIHKDQKGVVWLGTGKGVCQLSGDSIINFDVDSALTASTILNIREGANGSLWFCTTTNGLFRWNGSFMVHINRLSGLGHNYVFDVMPLGKYDAWIFGYDGLYYLKNNEAKVLKTGTAPAGSIFYCYQRDKAGNIWIGTSKGVLKYDGENFTRLTTDNGLVNEAIWKILQDREGNMWFASRSNGVSKLNSERFKLYHPDYFPDLHVNAVFRDRSGGMWLGTRKGIILWKDGDYTIFRDKDGLSSENIRDFDEDSKGNIYMATNYGVTKYDGKKFTAYYSEVNKLNSCWDITVDNDRVWIGTTKGPAVLENGYITQPYNGVAFDNNVFDICRKDNGLWFAYEDGLLKFDGKKFTQLKSGDGFFDGRVRSIKLDESNRLWFGTNDGVFRWDGIDLKNYNTKDGLLSEAIYSLDFQKDGSLWVGQAKGLSRLTFYNNELEDVIRYSKDQGFLGLECNHNSIWMDPDGKVWVGTLNGLVEYDPALDKGIYYKPITRITSIKLFSQTVGWDLFADSITESGLPINLNLPYDKNHLTFEFSGVSLTSPVSINYSYILEGFDEDWSPITNNNVAAYANIPPGNYIFKVRAGFGDELWKNQPVEFEFKVAAPFYKTTWFYLICIALALGVAYSYYTIRKANFKITAQKQEIESQKNLIERKNHEMVDSINYASTIQSAILPSDEAWNIAFPDSFVLYKPKDIVSGDFYWMEERGDDVYFAAVDCTGHGVPGALMSIVGYNGLNQAINEHQLTEPGAILNYLSLSVNESLRKTERTDYVRDGMDIALCKLNRKNMTLEFAGAFNPLMHIRNGEMKLVKGDRTAIGTVDTKSKPFTNHIVDIEPGDCIYIYSDGYADQFGGKQGKKMKTSVMQKKVLEFHHLPMNQQFEKLSDYLASWQGSHDQLDDICVLGVRI